MNILITGARGFMGKNLCAALTGRCGDAHRLMLLDMPHTEEELLAAAAEADFVFHLAGVNRPTDPADFQKGQRRFYPAAADAAERARQAPTGAAQLVHSGGAGKSLWSEQIKRRTGRGGLCAAETGSAVYLYRLPNVFGKWSRPNYNSAVATFCHNVARGLPITVNDPSVTLRLVYIDDVVEEFLRAHGGRSPAGKANGASSQPVHEVNLGHMAELIQSFPGLRDSLDRPRSERPAGEKALRHLSQLPAAGGFLPAYRHPRRPARLLYGASAHGQPGTGQPERVQARISPRATTGTRPSMKNSSCCRARA